MRIHLKHKSLKVYAFYEMIDVFILSFQQIWYNLSKFISFLIIQSVVFWGQQKNWTKNVSLVFIPNQSIIQLLKYIKSSKDYCLKIIDWQIIDLELPLLMFLRMDSIYLMEIGILRFSTI